MASGQVILQMALTYGGLGHYDKTTWADCRDSGAALAENVNDILVAPEGTIWVAYENSGIGRYDGKKWTHYTTEDGLPSSMIYGLSLDEAGNLWVGTWEGVARFDGESWSVPYTARNDTIFNDRVHDIAFDSQNNIWVGHVTDGVSQYDPVSGSWIYHTAARSGLAGTEIRDLLVVPASQGLPEEVWIGTRDGGISRYTDGEWTTYDKRTGLISSNIRDLEIDRFRRVWAATDRGVVYQTESGWTTYNTLDTFHIAIGPSCPDKSCIFDEDVVWTATNGSGLTHSRLPLPEPVLDIRSVCLVDLERERECLDLSPLTISHTPIITATYTKLLMPGDIMRMEVTAVTRPPYQLRQDRGDFLSNADASDFNLFGAYPIIPVLDAIEPGQPFTFTDFDNPFLIPDLDDGQQEQTFISSWRVWMHTRYVGPIIRVVFTVAGE
jgi:ligand-binding sensor domain-containing protein